MKFTVMYQLFSITVYKNSLQSINYLEIHEGVKLRNIEVHLYSRIFRYIKITGEFPILNDYL